MYKAQKEEELSWKEFKKLFRKKYLFQRYFDSKEKEFYEIKMGQMSNDKYVTKFLELLRYEPYFKDEKVKVQIFINGLPQSFKGRIEFDDYGPWRTQSES